MGKKVLAPIHPGEVLLEDFLGPMGLSQYRLAKGISVPPRRINEIVKGKVTGINDGDVVLDINFKSDGLVPLSEFRDRPDLEIGDEVEASGDTFTEHEGDHEVIGEDEVRIAGNLFDDGASSVGEVLGDVGWGGGACGCGEDEEGR